MHVKIVFLLILLPSLNYSTGKTLQNKDSPTPTPPHMSELCDSNILQTKHFIHHLFTEQTAKPKIGYFITVKDKDNTPVYFSLKEEVTKHLGLIQLMKDEDDTPDTTPYEIQIPETLQYVTVNGVRTLLKILPHPFSYFSGETYWSSVYYSLRINAPSPNAQEYAEMLHAAHLFDETYGVRECLLNFTYKDIDLIINWLRVMALSFCIFGVDDSGI